MFFSSAVLSNGLSQNVEYVTTAITIWNLEFRKSKKASSSNEQKWHWIVCPCKTAVKLGKLWTPEIYMECYCAARKRLIRCEKTKLKTAFLFMVLNFTVIAQYTIDLSQSNQRVNSFFLLSQSVMRWIFKKWHQISPLETRPPHLSKFMQPVFLEKAMVTRI